MQKYKVLKDPTYGYWRLDPIPAEEELSEFYKKKYTELTKKGGRAPELRRLLAGGEEAKAELEWLRQTLYKDIRDMLHYHIHKQQRRVLDVGCGLGTFLTYMAEAGWDVVGVEPSEEEALLAREAGITVYNMTVEKFVAQYPVFKHSFDAVVLLNVLEHVPHPVKILDMTKELLSDGGMICLRVPNDFTELQICAQKKAGKGQWWVAIPDHINYFNCESLVCLVKSLGFKVVQMLTDFPMELFFADGG